jgi:hypothetical protein
MEPLFCFSGLPLLRGRHQPELCPPSTACREAAAAVVKKAHSFPEIRKTSF